MTEVVPSISSAYKSLIKMGSHEESKFNCMITGAGGFVGQALASALLADPLISKLTLTDVFKPDVPQTKTQSGVEIRSLDADLTSLETCQSLFTPDINLIYLLHGIMSGAAEANLELGLKVNVDSTRQILDILRHTNPGVKVIYPSSLAVYGPPATPTTKITELNAPVPGSSCELSFPTKLSPFHHVLGAGDLFRLLRHVF